MINTVTKHNQFHENGLKYFQQSDPHLRALSELAYQYGPTWWHDLSLKSPGIYILTGGRQIGKSTSCKLLIEHCLQKKLFEPKNILYLPCDEIFDAKELSSTIRFFLASTNDEKFLLIIDEVTFYEYVDLVYGKKSPNKQQLSDYFNDYLQCGGYLRAINDYAAHKKILPSTFLTYEQWIRGDFLKHAKREDVLLLLLQALFSIGVSQASYSTITQKMGLVSKDTVIDYCELLGRMDVLFYLQAFDQNKKLGFPKKDRKFHFIDPFIYRTLHNWLLKEGYLNAIESESIIAEACVASHCYRLGRTFYFKGQGEIDVIWLHDKKIKAIEVKWANQIRSNDLKTLKHFENSIILCKGIREGIEHDVTVMPISQFLYEQILR